MSKNYYLLCIGDNWDKIICDNVEREYNEDKDLYDHDAIRLKKTRTGTVTETRHSFFKGPYYVQVSGLIDCYIYVEKLENCAQDIITGIEFPIYPRNENEKVLFHCCYKRDEKDIVNFLKSLSEDDIKRYKIAMLEFKKAILRANENIVNSMKEDTNYIEQFKKKHRC